MSRKALIFGYLILLAVLHQDWWLKDNPNLVFGLFPVTLAYHMGFVMAAAIGWFLVTRFVWPDELDGVPTEVDPSGKGGKGVS